MIGMSALTTSDRVKQNKGHRLQSPTEAVIWNRWRKKNKRHPDSPGLLGQVRENDNTNNVRLFD